MDAAGKTDILYPRQNIVVSRRESVIVRKLQTMKHCIEVWRRMVTSLAVDPEITDLATSNQSRCKSNL